MLCWGSLDPGPEVKAGCPSTQNPPTCPHRHQHTLMSSVPQVETGCCHNIKTALEYDEDLKAPTWPQNTQDPNLTGLHGICLKDYNPKSAAEIRGFTFSEAMFGWILCVKEHPDEHQDPDSSTRTLYLNHHHWPVIGFNAVRDPCTRVQSHSVIISFMF